MAANSGGLRKALFRSPPTIETPTKNPGSYREIIMNFILLIEIGRDIILKVFEQIRANPKHAYRMFDIKLFSISISFLNKLCATLRFQ
jgi:hypothetical protein